MAYSSSQFVFREELEEVCTEVVEEECTLQEEQVCQQVAEEGGMSQSLKLSLVPRTQILGQFGPPKKCVNFDICNRRNKWVYCVY